MKMLLSKIELDSKRSRDLIPLECLQCKRTHYRTKNIVLRILNGNHQGTQKGCFCSQECKNEYLTISQKYSCKECGVEIWRRPSELGTNVFCSTSCSAKYNNRSRIISSICLNCQTSFHPYRGSKKMKFCASKCYREYNNKINIEKMKSGNHSFGKTSIRKYIIQIHGNKCMSCGWNSINPKSKKCPIQIDHIDGNSDNNNFNNLRLLCPNCHSLTPTFMALNYGNGRHYRRMRYKAGKSS